MNQFDDIKPFVLQPSMISSRSRWTSTRINHLAVNPISPWVYRMANLFDLLIVMWNPKYLLQGRMEIWKYSKQVCFVQELSVYRLQQFIYSQEYTMVKTFKTDLNVYLLTSLYILCTFRARKKKQKNKTVKVMYNETKHSFISVFDSLLFYPIFTTFSRLPTVHMAWGALKWSTVNLMCYQLEGSCHQRTLGWKCKWPREPLQSFCVTKAQQAVKV